MVELLLRTLEDILNLAELLPRPQKMVKKIFLGSEQWFYPNGTSSEALDIAYGKFKISSKAPSHSLVKFRMSSPRALGSASVAWICSMLHFLLCSFPIAPHPLTLPSALQMPVNSLDICMLGPILSFICFHSCLYFGYRGYNKTSKI